ncbi:MAG: anion permease [Chromatiales bacterium]|nr:anion permease [Chromatiales bacterium]
MHKSRFDLKKTLILLAGMAVFLVIYFSPPWSVAVDPTGKEFVLSQEGKAAIGLFLMAGIWWVFEVIPIGVTAIAIGVFQALFAIRPAKEAFRDFMDPSVMFIFGSMVIGLAFTKSGLTKRTRLQDAGGGGREHQHDPARHHDRDRGAGASHGTHRGGGHHVSHPAGHLRPLRRGRKADQLRQEPVHRHGLCRRAPAASSPSSDRRAPRPRPACTRSSPARTSAFFDLPLYLALMGWGMVFLIWLYLITFLKPEKKDDRRPARTRSAKLSAALGPMTVEEKIVLAMRVRRWWC